PRAAMNVASNANGSAKTLWLILMSAAKKRSFSPTDPAAPAGGAVIWGTGIAINLLLILPRMVRSQRPEFHAPTEPRQSAVRQILDFVQVQVPFWATGGGS